jgi:hypothetical protein
MAFFAGLVDAVAGGGGLIQVPALFAAYPNVPPATLLSTNKILGIYKLPSELKGDDGLIEMKDDITKWI